MPFFSRGKTGGGCAFARKAVDREDVPASAARSQANIGNEGLKNKSMDMQQHHIRAVYELLNLKELGQSFLISEFDFCSRLLLFSIPRYVIFHQSRLKRE